MIMEQTRPQNLTEGGTAPQQDSPPGLKPEETTAAKAQATAIAAAAAAAAVTPAASHPEMTSARALRPHARTTLQPSVQDFNGKIMNRTLMDTDEDQILWMVGASPGRSILKLHPDLDPNHHHHQQQQQQQQQAFPAPVPTTFRWSSTSSPSFPITSFPLPVSPVHLDPSYYTSRLPVPSAPSERVTAWTEDVHRRHVARTARARARLSPKPLVVPFVPSKSRSAGGGRSRGGARVLDSVLEPSFSLNVSMTAANHTTKTTTAATTAETPTTARITTMSPGPLVLLPSVAEYVVEEEIRCLSRPYHNSARNTTTTTTTTTATTNKDHAAAATTTTDIAIGALTARSRPATTTGRYFDRSNGLRSTKAAPMTARGSRPYTAGRWSWSSPAGLSIQKVVLRPKEVV